MDAERWSAPGRRVSDPAELLRQAHAAHADHRFGAAFDAFVRPTGLVSSRPTTCWPGRTPRGGSAGRTRRSSWPSRVTGGWSTEGETTRAAQEAIGLGFLLMLRGDFAAGSGWLQRGRSLLERSPEEVARGYLAHLDAEQALHGGDLHAPSTWRTQARDAARGCGPCLLSLALMTEGTARLRDGAVAEALALLDEAMLPVQAGQIHRISPATCTAR